MVPPSQHLRPGAAVAATTQSGSASNDALDELLSHARVTLERPEGLRGLATKKPKSIPRRADAPSMASSSEARRRSGPPSDTFWRPRCNAHLWSDGGSSLSDDSSCDEDRSVSSESTEDHGESDFEDDPAFLDLLKAAERFAEQAGKARAAGHGFPNIPPPPPVYAGMQSSRRHSSEPPISKDKPGNAEPRLGETPRRCSNYSRDSQAYGSAAPHFKEKGSRQSTAAHSKAGIAAGAPATGASTRPEADVRAALTAAQAEGPGAARKVLKQLLLRWHPDKAIQGDSPAAVAAQEEATRVLRFVLQERKRLGL